MSDKPEKTYQDVQIGDGVTEYCYSDRHAYTVIAMSKSKKTLTLQQDNAIRTDSYGMSDVQDYRYEANPQGSTRTVTLRKDGRYRQKGALSDRGSTTYVVGHRRAYHDYSF